DQLQPVVGPRPIGSLCKSVFDQRCVEQVACIVAGERATRAVGALHPRCKTNNQQASLDVAEGRNRRIVPGRLARPVRLSKGYQPRTERAVTVGYDGGRLAA